MVHPDPTHVTEPTSNVPLVPTLEVSTRASSSRASPFIPSVSDVFAINRIQDPLVIDRMGRGILHPVDVRTYGEFDLADLAIRIANFFKEVLLEQTTHTRCETHDMNQIALLEAQLQDDHLTIKGERRQHGEIHGRVASLTGEVEAWDRLLEEWWAKHSEEVHWAEMFVVEAYCLNA
uniref:Uncharacterized protein n=1 Tax=Nelumbo nucifera TaxID=4432 RepID=A0A822YGE1_NELNU|nr:TPA_asm: hypothetical protein HUJ06_031523 [Nelumbo nucifera]